MTTAVDAILPRRRSGEAARPNQRQAFWVACRRIWITDFNGGMHCRAPRSPLASHHREEGCVARATEYSVHRARIHGEEGGHGSHLRISEILDPAVVVGAIEGEEPMAVLLPIVRGCSFPGQISTSGRLSRAFEGERKSPCFEDKRPGNG
jgi:hypothetical protein